MFENMTQREKVLAMVVGALVPITLIFMGVFWFIEKNSLNDGEIMSLSEQVSRENEKTALSTKANSRRIYYRSVSMPSNLADATNDYLLWLNKLAGDEIKMEGLSVAPLSGDKIKFKSKVVGNTKKFAMTATGNLSQLSEFLTKFYSVDLLHRINSLKVIPLTTGPAKAGKRVLSGNLNLSITVEVLSLVDADEQREFTSVYREMARTSEEYQNGILRRNIFGPANNTPSLSGRPSSSYVSGKDIKVSLTGEDADKNDLLSFELIEGSIEGVKLVQTDSKSRRASLQIPGQKAGRYEFKVGVKDNGFPAKTNEKKFTVVFKDFVAKKEKPKPPPAPAYVNAKQARITGIVKDLSGDWMVWIKVRTTGERFKLKVGETFNLDEREWLVESIEPGAAVLKVDNKLLTFQPADPFDSPRKEVSLEPVGTESSDDLKVDDALEGTTLKLKTDANDKSS